MLQENTEHLQVSILNTQGGCCRRKTPTAAEKEKREKMMMGKETEHAALIHVVVMSTSAVVVALTCRGSKAGVCSQRSPLWKEPLAKHSNIHYKMAWEDKQFKKSMLGKAERRQRRDRCLKEERKNTHPSESVSSTEISMTQSKSDCRAKQICTGEKNNRIIPRA